MSQKREFTKIIVIFQYEKVLKRFGEDPKKIQPNEFFGSLDVFVSHFKEAQIENRRFQRLNNEGLKREPLTTQVG